MKIINEVMVMSTILRKIKSGKEIRRNTEVSLSVGNTFCFIKGDLPSNIIRRIDKELSFDTPGAKYSRAYQMGMWDGKTRFLKKKPLNFPVGFVDQIIKILEESKIDCKIKDLRKKIKVKKSNIEKSFTKNKLIIPRTYQKKSTFKALNEGFGIINLPTGGGKTLVINLIIASVDYEFKKKCTHLITASGIGLCRQLQEQISKFQHEEIGFIGQSQFDIKRITVASIDSLYQSINYMSFKKKKSSNHIERLKKKNDTLDLLADSTTLFLDEAHHSPAKTFKDIFYKTKARLRIGTTATYIRSGDGEGMLLKSVTGNVIYKKTLSWMINNGYLARPTIILMEYNRKEKSNIEIDNEYKKHMLKKDPKITDRKLKKATFWNKLYTVEISHNDIRNQMYAKALHTFYMNKLSIVLFVKELYQGQSIYDFAITKYKIPEKRIKFLSGKDDVGSVRLPVLKSFKKGDIRILICTRILNEGIDFPEANCGIRAGGEVFSGNIIQQLGRILRKIKSTLAKDSNKKQPQHVFWFDLCDLHHQLLADHSLGRIKTYESEKAFNVIYINNLKDLQGAIDGDIEKTKIIKCRSNKNSSNNKNSEKKER
jgi:superfamily II DNA or RNA helicase